MRTTRKDVTRILSDAAESELDDFLAEQRFCRGAGSLGYSRQISDGMQFLKVHFDLNPKYEPGAIAHVLPQLSAVLPELNKSVLEMMGDMPSLDGAGGVTFSEQLQNAAPRDARLKQSRWFVYDRQSALECVASISEFMRHWSVPFLNRYTSVAALTEGYEQQDECLPHDRRFFVFIIGAYIVLGRPAKAMQVLETKFGKAGPRREYAKAFEYVSALLAK